MFRLLRRSFQVAKAATLVLLGLAAIAGPVRADIVAATDLTPQIGGNNLDVFVIDASTGQFPLALPFFVNTSAQELHPSFSMDGRYLVFERRSTPLGAGTIEMADRSTGAVIAIGGGNSSDPTPPINPEIDPLAWVGTSCCQPALVTTGIGRTACSPRGSPIVNTFDVSRFPGGPFPRAIPGGSRDYAPCRTLEPSAFGREVFPNSAFAIGVFTNDSVFGRQLLAGTDWGGGVFLSGLDQPQTDPNDPSKLVAVTHLNIEQFSKTIIPGACLDAICFQQTPPTIEVRDLGPVPGTNTGDDESRPSWALAQGSAYGRYLGFRRHRFSDGHDLLLVFDRLTQTIVDSVDLGPVFQASNPPEEVSRAEGSVSLYVQPVLTAVKITTTVSFTSLTSTSAGLLVERIVGQHKLLGRNVPKLRVVGRVPLGAFRRGRHQAHWDFAVNGHKLGPGKYYVTLRAIKQPSGSKAAAVAAGSRRIVRPLGPILVRDLSRPFLLTIHRNGTVTVRPVRGNDRQ